MAPKPLAQTSTPAGHSGRSGAAPGLHAGYAPVQGPIPFVAGQKEAMDDDLTQEDIDEWATVEGIDEVISASESPQSPQGSDADKEQFPQEPAKVVRDPPNPVDQGSTSVPDQRAVVLPATTKQIYQPAVQKLEANPKQPALSQPVMPCNLGPTAQARPEPKPVAAAPQPGKPAASAQDAPPAMQPGDSTASALQATRPAGVRPPGPPPGTKAAGPPAGTGRAGVILPPPLQPGSSASRSSPSSLPPAQQPGSNSSGPPPPGGPPKPAPVPAATPAGPTPAAPASRQTASAQASAGPPGSSMTPQPPGPIKVRANAAPAAASARPAPAREAASSGSALASAKPPSARTIPAASLAAATAPGVPGAPDVAAPAKPAERPRSSRPAGTARSPAQAPARPPAGAAAIKPSTASSSAATAAIAAADRAGPAQATPQAEIEPAPSAIPKPQTASRSSASAPADPQAAAPAASGWGGGWGAWNKLGASLREVAAGAARDVRELTDSFQQVLQEVTAETSDSDVEHSDNSATAQEPAEAGSRALPGGPGPNAQEAAAAHEANRKRAVAAMAQQGSRAPSAQADQDVSPELMRRRQQVLERLQGEDTSLELGLAAIDDQVEQLAQGVSQTFGSLWGGARGVLRGGLTYGQRVAERLEEAAAAAAKELAETVEEGVRDASSGLAAAAGNTRRVGGLLASRAEHGLEEFGRQAIELLEGDLPPGGAAARRIAGEEATFDHCFYIYGGRQSLEELEALSNECARVCNRLRARLPDADKAQLDSTLTMLSPLFNLEGQAGGDEAAAGAEGGAAVDSPLARGHAVVVELRNAGVAKASKLVTELSERSTRPAATTAPGLAGTQGAPADSEQAEALQRVRGEGVRCLGELAALCVERMLALARSVSAQFRFSRPTDDDIQWPPGCKDKAALLCAQAKLMLTDLETLVAAFVAALAQAAQQLEGSLAASTSAAAHADPAGSPSAAQPPASTAASADKDQSAAAAAAVSRTTRAAEGAGSGSVQQRAIELQASAKALGKELGADCTAAQGRVQEAYRGLMYVVLLTTLDRSLLEAR